MFDSIKVLKYTKLIEYFNLVIYQYISYRTALSIKVYKTSESNKKNPDFRYPKFLQERLSMILQSNGMDPNLTTLSLAQKSSIQDSQKKYKTDMRPVFKLLNTTKAQELHVPDLSTMQIQYLSQKYRKGQLDIDEDWAQQVSMMPKSSRRKGGGGGGV